MFDDCCPVGWMMLLGSGVRSNSAFWTCIDWLKHQSMLGNDCVAWAGFDFTGQKSISRVTFEKVAHYLSLDSFFTLVMLLLINKMWNRLIGVGGAERAVASCLLWLCTQCKEGDNSICFLYCKMLFNMMANAKAKLSVWIQNGHIFSLCL